MLEQAMKQRPQLTGGNISSAQVSEISSLLNRLDNAISDAHIQASILHDKINPVLEPVMPSESAYSDTLTNTDLGARIYGMSKEVERLVSHLASMNNRVAL